MDGLYALIGILLGWWLNEKSHQRRRASEEVETRRKVALALKCEVEILRKKIESNPPDGVGKSPGLIHENYFGVFDSNTAVIGQVDEAEITLSFYGNAKEHLDCLRAYSAAHLQWQANMNNGQLGKQVGNTHQDLVRRRGPLLVESADVITRLERLSLRKLS